MKRCGYCADRGFIAYFRLVKILSPNRYYQCGACKATKIEKEG